MKDIENIFKQYKKALLNSLESVDAGSLKKAISLIYKAYKEDKQIFICGNGGSAATATHLACDLGKGTAIKNKKRLKVISLSDNVSLLTAWSNDTDFKNCFKEQLVNLLEKGDVVIGISASGNSENVLEAIRYAKAGGAKTIGLIGFGGGKLSRLVDIAVLINSDEYEVTEDIQLCLGHVIKRGFLEFIKKPN